MHNNDNNNITLDTAAVSYTYYYYYYNIKVHDNMVVDDNCSNCNARKDSSEYN